jgi:hypothetical protein
VEHRHTIIVPATCLIEAYAQLDGEEEDRLGLLHASPAVAVTAFGSGDITILAGMTRRFGWLGLAHAVLATMTHQTILACTEKVDVDLGQVAWQIWQLPSDET